METLADQDRALLTKAADIFIRLSEDPTNEAVLAERDAFMALGEEERRAYENVSRAWQGVGRRPGAGKVSILAIFALLLGSSYLSFDPLRKLISADFATDLASESIRLESGDLAYLDAATSIAEDSSLSGRQITLLDGAAVFDVASDGRPFEVIVGDLNVEVLGTVFETSLLGDDVMVAVTEGAVSVSADGNFWRLEAGDQLLWSHERSDARIEQRELEDIAVWRRDRFVADGLTLAQVAGVIDRRLPGTVYIPGSALSDARVSGTIDLSKPVLALEAVAASRGARLTSLGPLGYILHQ